MLILLYSNIPANYSLNSICFFSREFHRTSTDIVSDIVHMALLGVELAQSSVNSLRLRTIIHVSGKQITYHVRCSGAQDVEVSFANAV